VLLSQNLLEALLNRLPLQDQAPFADEVLIMMESCYTSRGRNIIQVLILLLFQDEGGVLNENNRDGVVQIVCAQLEFLFNTEPEKTMSMVRAVTRTRELERAG